MADSVLALVVHLMGATRTFEDRSSSHNQLLFINATSEKDRKMSWLGGPAFRRYLLDL